ncbi:hypothetical protein J7337_005123 [Fusarium musae]|uniref:Meiotic recombination protein DMC1 n=1 Tax=Fusarium musae TaxID=1042133 RepID=A0A9P8IPB5_9HYPO|nr:hypothetical protein J7337_005123 [Fusarium musae]KAG9502296.1 hypothetical protein J7337_005123 [Fusarium musae]
MESPGPGGFLPAPAGASLPSPAPSSASSFSNIQGLPTPRTKALKPNSSKEFMVRRYAEEQLLLVTRKYVKKFGNPEPGDTVVGYTRFGEVCRDLDSIINVLWKSGTRQDIETHEALPGFENGLRGGMTTTEMIRCRSLVDQCRVLMVEVMRDPAEEDEEEEEAETDTETEAEEPGIKGWGGVEDDDEMMLQLDAARVFEKTIVQLNERLGDLEPLQMSAD